MDSFNNGFVAWHWHLRYERESLYGSGVGPFRWDPCVRYTLTGPDSDRTSVRINRLDYSVIRSVRKRDNAPNYSFVINSTGFTTPKVLGERLEGTDRGSTTDRIQTPLIDKKMSDRTFREIDRRKIAKKISERIYRKIGRRYEKRKVEIEIYCLRSYSKSVATKAVVLASVETIRRDLSP